MGNHHSGAVCDDGLAYTWGDLTYGKLGHSKELLHP